MADTPLTDMEANLRALGAQADAGTLDASSIPSMGEESEAPPAAPVKEATPSEAGEPSQPAAAAEETSETKSAESTAEKPAEAKPETPYEKAKREGKDREAKAWQKIDEAKAEVEKERQAIAAERAKQPAEQILRDQKGYSEADYEDAAKGFDDQGDPELAKACRLQGKAIQEAEQQRRQQEFQKIWDGHIGDALTASPELKDSSSPMGEAVKAIIKESPLFSLRPDGFKYIAEIARSRTQAAALPALQSKIEALTKENERLTKLTSLSATPPARRSGVEGDKSEMDLRRMAEEYDDRAYS